MKTTTPTPPCDRCPDPAQARVQTHARGSVVLDEVLCRTHTDQAKATGNIGIADVVILPLVLCGTPAGRAGHHARGEAACDACTAALAAFEAAEQAARRKGSGRRIREAALRMLADAHPVEYDLLLADAAERDAAMFGYAPNVHVPRAGGIVAP